MGLIPDEARALPPPSLVNRTSVYLGFLGYLSSILHNAINQYPVLKAGVHRQILFTTVGIFVGYHLTKYENYKYAKRDRELFDYIRRHPEILPHKESRTMAEVYEKFYPVR
ncbi:NADH dehydrogenase [ubiquinone] 1 subunit C2 [Dendropsophus ebraccatus]|uniref:NADH dehydrogenase [ubiquinone] 1 subunit C2 n=1 Tax=Dendropsophus ebraccatus TaxID=150705 RepID=UPI003831A3B3